MCDPDILDMIPEKQAYDFARDLFPKLLKNGENINGVLARGNWTDVGSPAAYRQAQRWMLAGMPGTIIEGRFTTKDARINGPLHLGHNVSVGSNSAIVGPIIIGENTVIGDNVLIGPYTTIGSNCTIDDDSRILSSYIFNDVTVGKNTNVSGSIIDNRTTVGNNCSLENGTVIGPDVVVGSGATIHSNVKIWPKQTIKEGVSVKENIVSRF
jgi:mannose-1-phosphate guanylyltransferase